MSILLFSFTLVYLSSVSLFHSCLLHVLVLETTLCMSARIACAGSGDNSVHECKNCMCWIWRQLCAWVQELHVLVLEATLRMSAIIYFTELNENCFICIVKTSGITLEINFSETKILNRVLWQMYAHNLLEDSLILNYQFFLLFLNKS